MFLKLLVLLYADDTIILSDGIDKLQHSLKVYKEYCQIWKLQVNLSKTKVVIFSRDKIEKITVSFCCITKLLKSLMNTNT